MLPIFVNHTFWRPRERAWVGVWMRERDAERLRAELEEGVRLAESLGIDVREVELPRV